MQKWKQKLYQSYVSTGQSTAETQGGINSSKKNDPYFNWLIKKTLGPKTSIKILDLACGDGSLLHALAALGFQNAIGVDISEEQISIAQKSWLKNVICDEAAHFLDAHPNKTFDVIFMMDILEHLSREEMMDLLQKVHNRLESGGKLIIQVPNATGIFGMNTFFGDLTHEFAFTKKSISQLLSFCKFEIESVGEIKPIIHGITSLVRRIIWNIGTLHYRILLAAESGHFGHILSQNMLVIARKKS